MIVDILIDDHRRLEDGNLLHWSKRKKAEGVLTIQTGVLWGDCKK
jgi:hypothetical protein